MASIFDNGTIFPYPNGTNVNSIVDLILYNNSVTGGWFGPAMLLTFFLIAVVSLKSFEINKAFTAASFVTAIVALLFQLMGIIPGSGTYLWYAFGFLALGVIWLKFER